MNLYCSKLNVVLGSYLYTLEFSGIVGFLAILIVISAIICSILFILYFTAYKSLKKNYDKEQIEYLHLSSRNRELLYDINIVKEELESFKDESAYNTRKLKNTIEKLYKYSIDTTDNGITDKDVYLKKYLEAKKSFQKLETELRKERVSNKNYRQEIKNLKSIIDDIEYKNEENIHHEAERIALLLNSDKKK